MAVDEKVLELDTAKIRRAGRPPEQWWSLTHSAKVLGVTIADLSSLVKLYAVEALRNENGRACLVRASDIVALGEKMKAAKAAK